MAGRGERMLHRGPFKSSILLNGRSVFEWLLRSISAGIKKDDILVLVIQRSDFEAFNIDSEYRNIVSRLGMGNAMKFVLVDHVLNGPARSVQLAVSNLSNESQVIVVNTDQFNYIDISQEGNWCGVGLDFGSSKSYIKVSGNRIVDIAEKVSISHLCSTGVYSFQSISYLKSLYDLVSWAPNDGELYLSHLIKIALDKGDVFSFKESLARFDLGCEEGASGFEKFITLF
jgi:bifunctional N-acetylglucosamine-1-phosphate-uridyltransferase/glucosamine-1-phosphate-acetyltransferase GlmU-like protein